MRLYKITIWGETKYIPLRVYIQFQLNSWIIHSVSIEKENSH